MAESAVAAMKARMRADLSDALRSRRKDEVTVLRSLLAAIDNAEAPPLGSRPIGAPSEVDRLVLSDADLQAVLSAEVQERERAAAEFSGHGRPDQAELLLAQARIVMRYVGKA